MMKISRRNLLRTGGLATLAGLLGAACAQRPALAASTHRFEIEFTEAQWRERLTPAQYAVLRQSATERAFTSPLNDEHRKGTFACAGCALPLYSSATKFDSGTGWPSFWEPLPDAVGEESDTTLFMVRTAVHCRRCGGHLGHVFDDGPRPTGKRYCMNGVAMTFAEDPA